MPVFFYVQRILFTGGTEKGLDDDAANLLFSFFNDGGGVDIKTQSRAEFKEPLRDDVQFV